MKRLAPWAWLVVLGTALALSWWSLDSVALRFGMPKLLAGMVSATFDGAALVAADLALRRAARADPAFAVKLLMVTTVGLSAWLNAEHAIILGYPMAARVLFAAPSVISGWLFELQLRSLHRERVQETGRGVRPLPRLGVAVWVFHPIAALRRLSQIAGSRLRSVPVTVMDWQEPVRTAVAVLPLEPPALERQIGAAAGDAGDVPVEPVAPVLPRQSGRAPVPDELYLERLRDLVAEDGGVVPSIREVTRRLSIGQDRARRLVAVVQAETIGQKARSRTLRPG